MNLKMVNRPKSIWHLRLASRGIQDLPSDIDDERLQKYCRPSPIWLSIDNHLSLIGLSAHMQVTAADCQRYLGRFLWRLRSSSVQIAIDRAQIAREVLATEELTNITGTLNPYDTTEVHCNEFYPNSTVDTLSVEFSSSAYLASLLLESFYFFLGKPCLLSEAHRPSHISTSLVFFTVLCCTNASHYYCIKQCASNFRPLLPSSVLQTRSGAIWYR